MVTAWVRHPWLLSVSVLLSSLVAGPLANAASLRRANWRLEGYVGQAPAGTKAEAHLVLQSNNKEYEFDLTKAAMISGRGSHGQLARDLKPYQNKLLVREPAAATDALRNAAPGQKLLIFGYHRSGSRELQVTKISAAAPESPPLTK